VAFSAACAAQNIISSAIASHQTHGISLWRRTRARLAALLGGVAGMSPHIQRTAAASRCARITRVRCLSQQHPAYRAPPRAAPRHRR